MSSEFNAIHCFVAKNVLCCQLRAASCHCSKVCDPVKQNTVQF